MCGIAGLLFTNGAPPSARVLEQMSCCLQHRGPDDSGILLFGGENLVRARTAVEAFERFPSTALTEVAFVHRRLSILDLSVNGWQPMASPDGRYHLVFNGEVYNYIELRRELKILGHSFASSGDSEVLLAAMSQWGPPGLTRLKGMFAFALLDTATRSVLLARDPFGIKPMYFVVNANGVAFASEIGALQHVPGVARTVNHEAAYAYLRNGITDRGTQTLFAEVQQLPAAHYLRIALDSPTQLTPYRYWQCGLASSCDLSFDEAAEALRGRFLNNVALHLRSDVPVGAALSGGIDSSAIVSAMRLVAPQLDLHAFSYVASDGAVSEEPWMDLSGTHANVRLHKIRLDSALLRGEIDAVIGIQGEPFGSTSIFAQYHIFKRAQEEGVKVMLDGQGADEVFGGYHYFIAARVASLLRSGELLPAARLLSRAIRLPAENASSRSLRDKFTFILSSLGFLVPSALTNASRFLARREAVPAWMSRHWVERAGVSALSPFFQRGGKDVLRASLLDQLTSSSLPALLRYEDRNSMAFSIESRVPFLTTDLVEFALSLPEQYLISDDGITKAIFRAALRGIVPDAILDRKDKIGFSTPEAGWLVNAAPEISALLESEHARSIPAFQHDEMLASWRRTRDGLPGGAHARTIWRWCNLVKWSLTNDARWT